MNINVPYTTDDYWTVSLMKDLYRYKSSHTTILDFGLIYKINLIY